MADARGWPRLLLGLMLMSVAGTPVACMESVGAPVLLPDTSGLRVPPGFRAKAGTVSEPYSGTGWAKEIVHDLTGMEFVFIPAGEFDMGSSDSERDRTQQEGPVRRVKLTRPFYMGRYEVTQGQWRTVMKSNPSDFRFNDQRPVEQVSWNECRKFLWKAGGRLRLPTEAQWEYACRAGTKTRFSYGDDPDGGQLSDYAWYRGNSGNRTHSVGKKKPNAWGLYDMHGNVMEWCEDEFADDYYAKGASVDPKGPTPRFSRVQRGGDWLDSPAECRSAWRVSFTPMIRMHFTGFRAVVTVDP